MRTSVVVAVALWIGGITLFCLTTGDVRVQAAERRSEKGSTSSANKGETEPNSAGKSKDADDADFDADLSSEVDEDLTALTLPADLLGKVDTSNRLKFTQSLRALLVEGISPDGSAIAKRNFESAHRAVSNDPRARYAYGLALLEQKNPKDALAQFRAAAKDSPGPYLPAWQASIWTLLTRHEYGPALTMLQDFARSVEQIPGSWPTENDRLHSAEWLGRTLGFLIGPGSTSEFAAKFAETNASIESTLTGDRKRAFKRGGKGVAKRQQELEAWAARPLAELVSEMNAKRQDARVSDQAARDEVKRIQDEIRDAKRPFDQRIAESKKDLRTFSQQAKNAAKNIPDLEDQVAFLSVPQQKPNGYNTYRGRPTTMRWRNENTQEKKARETQLSAAQQKLQQANNSVSSAKQGMTDSRKEQDLTQSDMRKALGPKQLELAEARRKSQEAAAHLRDVEHAVLSPEQMKSRPRSYEAYVPLDVLAEKDRLLATIKSS
jgi:hypothetical protein